MAFSSRKCDRIPRAGKTRAGGSTLHDKFPCSEFQEVFDMVSNPSTFQFQLFQCEEQIDFCNHVTLDKPHCHNKYL